jgi:serine/threonine protein kinase
MNVLMLDLWNSAGVRVKGNDMPGDVIEGYRLARELGMSFAGRSFLGERISPTASHERVVIQLWDATDQQAQQQAESILRKLTRLQPMDQTHILPILSVGIHEGVLYSITEFLSCESLSDLLQRNPSGQPLPEEQALSLLAQLGQALHSAHQQQIVHGRLNPHNVLLKTDNQVLLTNFHLSPLLPLDQTGITDPSDLSIYLAPEQSSGDTDARSDQYALGCLAYEMLTGAKVFMVSSVNTPGKYYKTKALIMPRQLNPALSEQVEEAILKALSKDPTQRFEDIPAFLNVLGLSSTAAEMKGKQKRITATDPMRPLIPILPKGPNGDLPTEDSQVQQAQRAFPLPTRRQGGRKKRWKQVLTVILCLLAIAVEVGMMANLRFPHIPTTVNKVSAKLTTASKATPKASPSSQRQHPQPSVQPGVTPSSIATQINPTSVATQTPTPTPSTQQAPASPPVGYWKFDEGSGTTAADSSSNGYTAQLQSGASWAPGRAGSSSLSLNGNSNSYALVPEPVANTASSFTVAAWVNLNSVSNPYQTFVSQDGNAVSAFYLQLNANTGQFAFTRQASDSTSAATTTVSSSFVPTPGIWYHLAGVYDASAQTISLYVNGSLQQTEPYTGSWQGSGHTAIGRGLFNGQRTDFFNGQISAVRIYNTALSAKDIQALANSQ